MITTIIIVNFNTMVLLKDCLSNIFKSSWRHQFKVWVVDNCSTDGSVEMVEKEFPEVSLIKNNVNTGFTVANNQVLGKVKSDYYLLLNSDTKVQDNSLDKLVDFMEKSDFGIGSCKLLNKDGSFQPNGGDLPFGWALLVWVCGWDDILPVIRMKLPSFHRKFINFYAQEKEVGWVSGSVMMIKRKVVEKIGLFDPAIFMYGEDVEYCLRAKKAGFKIGWTNQAEIIHLGGGSSKQPEGKQWVGEYKGLIYIYQKYLGAIPAFVLKLLIYVFTIIRALSFLVIGRPQISKTYAKILFDI